MDKRTCPIIINFDLRIPQQRDDESFKKFSATLQNCLSASCFFLFHDIKSNGAGVNSSSVPNVEKDTQEEMPFSDHFDIAIGRFKATINEHVSNLTVTDEEIANIERLTRGQNKNKLWYDKNYRG